MRLLKLTLMLAFAVCCTISKAQIIVTHTIDFDTDARGHSIQSDDTISEQYANWGVHFVPNVLSGKSATNFRYATNTLLKVTSSDFDPYYVDNADPSELPTGNLLGRYADYSNENGDSNFWLKFDRPAFDLSLNVYGTGVFDPFFAVYGLDSDLNFLSFGAIDTSNSPNGFSGLVTLDSNAPISYLIITGGFDAESYDTWTGVDNIRFKTVVPEPGAAALLLGVVVSGAVWRRRLRKPSR